MKLEYYIYGIPNTYGNGVMSFDIYDSPQEKHKKTNITTLLFAVKNGNDFFDVFTNTEVKPEFIIAPTTVEAVKVACLNFVDNNYSKCLISYSNNITYANEVLKKYTINR